MQAVLKSFPAKVSDLAVLGFGTLTANAYAPRLAAWEHLAGIPKGRSNPLVKGGVHAPPENASVRGGRRSLSRELTPTAQREYHHFVIRGMSFQPSDLVSCAQRKRNFPYDFEATSSSGLLTFLAIVVGPVPEIWSDEHKGK